MKFSSEFVACCVVLLSACVPVPSTEVQTVCRQSSSGPGCLCTTEDSPVGAPPGVDCKLGGANKRCCLFKLDRTYITEKQPPACLCTSEASCELDGYPSYNYKIVDVGDCRAASASQAQSETVSGMPNVMLLIDRSGSLMEPLDPRSTNCPAGCGQSSPCPAACLTWKSELEDGLNAWLPEASKKLRLGLTFFPSENTTTCEAPTFASVPLLAANVADGTAAQQVQANSISSELAAVRGSGGTPTAAALRFLKTRGGLVGNGRNNFIVLISDSTPNCNESNPKNLCSCGSSCPSTAVSSCGCTTSSCGGSLCSTGCSDTDGAVAELNELRLLGVRTIVIRFGAGSAWFTELGTAGDTRATCAVDSDCGLFLPNLCVSGTCVTKYYNAGRHYNLTSALNRAFP